MAGRNKKKRETIIGYDHSSTIRTAKALAIEYPDTFRRIEFVATKDGILVRDKRPGRVL